MEVYSGRLLSNEGEEWESSIKRVSDKVKIGINILINSQGHIGAGPQHFSLVGVKPTQR